MKSKIINGLAALALVFTTGIFTTGGAMAQQAVDPVNPTALSVQEDQLLLGRAGCDGRYGILYPELDGDFLDIAVRDLPTREQIDVPVREQLIVELYSK